MLHFARGERSTHLQELLGLSRARVPCKHQDMLKAAKSSLEMPNSRTSPFTNSMGSPASSPTRNLGPCRSPRHSTWLVSSSSGKTPCLPSQLLRRLPDQRVDPLEVTAPAMGAVQPEDVGASLRWRLSCSPPLTWIIFGIISSLQDAGPKLATTLVFLNASLVSWRYHANAEAYVACFLLPMVTCSIGGTTSPVTQFQQCRLPSVFHCPETTQTLTSPTSTT